MLTEEEKEVCLREGRCVGCGNQLFELKKTTTTRVWRRLKRDVTFTPLTIDGQVYRGQCIPCRNAGATAPQKPTLPDHGQHDTTDHDPTEDDEVSSVEDNGPEPGSLGAETAIPLLPTTPSIVESVYFGSYGESGQPNGSGEMIWPNGDRYVGQFLDGKLHGQGTLLLINGTEYVGEWECNRMHGSGTFRFQNGDVYNGNYNHGQIDGLGRMYFGNGDLYVGMWQHGKMHGKGRYHYQNGQSFDGTFQNGARHGKGTYQWKDQSIVVHRYENDVRVGQGVQFSANRKRTWKWVDGKRRGRITRVQAEAILAAIM